MAIDIPRDRFVVIPGVVNPVVPQLYPVDNRPKMHRLTQNPKLGVVEIDNSHQIHSLISSLQEAKSDNFEGLAQQQPLVRAELMHPEQMRQILRTFAGSFIHGRRILAEIIEILPGDEQRVRLHRGPWKIKSGNQFQPGQEIDIEGLNLPPSSLALMDETWREAMGLPDGVDSALYVARPDQEDQLAQYRVMSWESKTRDYWALRTRPLNSKLTSDFAILGLGMGVEEGIADAKEYQQQLIDQELESRFLIDVVAKPSLMLPKIRKSRFSEVAQFVAAEGIALTPNFASILLRTEQIEWKEIIERWREEERLISEGEFNINNKVHVDLQFGRFREHLRGNYSKFYELVESNKSESAKESASYEQGEILKLSLKERQEAIYQAVENLWLYNFLESLGEELDGWKRKLVVVENLHTGIWGVEPIRDILRPQTQVFKTRFSSSTGEITLFPPELRDIITAPVKPVIAFVDGTSSVKSLGTNPRSFKHFWNYVQSVVSPDANEVYQLSQWNPDRSEMSIPGIEKPLESVEPDWIYDPTVILTNFTASPEKIPEWVKELVKRTGGSEHEPGFFDDWTKTEANMLHFSPYGLEITTGEMLLVSEIRKMMKRHFGRGRIVSRYEGSK